MPKTPKKFTKINSISFNYRENVSSGRSTPQNLTRTRAAFGSLSSCKNLGLSTSSIAESESQYRTSRHSSVGIPLRGVSRIPRKSSDSLSMSRDRLATSSSGRSTPLGGSRIPVWKGSQERINPNPAAMDDKSSLFKKRRTFSDLEVSHFISFHSIGFDWMCEPSN